MINVGPIMGISIFLVGVVLFLLNKLSSCSSYYIGYFSIILQGIGIGFAISNVL